MKRVASIHARGTEGCGVTKFQKEQAMWFARHGYEYRVFTMSDKGYARSKTHDVSDFTRVKFEVADQVLQMFEWCNEADVVFINSLPPKENGHTSPLPIKAYEHWKWFLENIKAPVALVQHDHKIYSLKRNALMDEAITAASMIFVHSSTNDFADYVRKNFNYDSSLDKFFGAVSPNIPIFSFQPGYSFDKTRWVPAREQDSGHHKWVGRSTSWKGYTLMFEFSKLLCGELNALVTLEGIDKSPGFLSLKGNYDFHSHVGSGLDKIDNIPIEQYRGTKPAVFSSFSNEGLLRRMARCGFGYQTSLLDAKFIERSIEYTHCEIIQAGAIPVFRKEYGESCRHRVTGDPFIHSKNNSTIWLGSENQHECINTISRLANDRGERSEWRNRAYEFYSTHQDSEHTFAEMMRHVDEVNNMKSAA